MTKFVPEWICIEAYQFHRTEEEIAMGLTFMEFLQHRKMAFSDEVKAERDKEEKEEEEKGK